MRGDGPKRHWLAGSAILVVVGVGLFSLTGASAQTSGPARPSGTHLVVVPHTPAGRAALGRAPARVVARYDAFTLVEAGAAATRTLIGAGADQRDDMRKVRIGGSTTAPAVARPSLLDKTGAALAAAGKGGEGLAVVQYVGPLKDAWIRAVRKTGVEVVSYMAQNGQLVSGGDAALRSLAKLSTSTRFVRTVTPYTAQDKLAAGLHRAGPQRVVVETVAGPAGAA